MAKDALDTSLSLIGLCKRFPLRISLTWLLVLTDAILMLLFPLFMGFAIDDLLSDSYRGLTLLGSIGLLSLVVGAARRFYDTRIYARIYATIAPELVAQEEQRGSSISQISARVNFANEIVEFLENYFPFIIQSAIALVGTIVIIWFLNIKVFAACLVATIFIAIIYALTSTKTWNLNSNANAELEKQVSVLSQNDKEAVNNHFRNVMRWNIRLSDLETSNFSFSWFFLLAVLLYSVIAVIDSGITAQGEILAILMYVFNYIESIVAFPLFYQQIVRLQEISHRLDTDNIAAAPEEQTPETNTTSQT